jgi:putative ABC transport system permease protein
MRTVVRLVRADLAGRRLFANVVLFVVFTLAATAIVAGFQSQDRAAQQWDAAFRAANGAHLTVSGAHPAELRRIANDPRVAAASHLYRFRDEVPVVSGSRGGPARIGEYPAADLPTVSKPLLRAGRWVKPGASREIVIERSFAVDQHLGVGDRVRVDPNGRDATFTVVGVSLDQFDCFYPQCQPTTVWVDPAGFARVVAGEPHFVEYLRLRDPATVGAFATKVLVSHPNVNTQDYLDTRGDALAVSNFFGAFLSGFGVFVMLAAAVVVAGLMASNMIARRRDLGLLKAVGCTPRQVAASVLVTNLLIGALATVAGWLIGGFVAGPLQLRAARVLGNGPTTFTLGPLVIALLIVELIVFAVTLVPAWRAGRLPTVAALARIPPQHRRGARLRRRVAQLPVGASARSAVLAAFVRPTRTIFTCLSVTLAAIAIVVTFGIGNTVDRVLADPAMTGDPYQVQIDSTGASPAQIVAAIRPVASSWTTAVEQRAVSERTSFLSRALGGDITQAGYVIRDGHTITAPNQAIVGWGLLDELGLSIGDRLNIKINAKPLSLRVVGWYSESEDSGRVLQLSVDALHQVDPSVTPTRYLLRLPAGDDPKTVAAAIHGTLGARAEITVNTPQDTTETDSFGRAFALVTLLVIMVSLAFLASTLLLAVRERSHDLGVLRAVGFTPAQVATITTVGALLLTAIGAFVGIPLGLVAYRGLSDAIGTGSGIGPGIGVTAPAGTISAALAALAAVAAGLGVAVSRRPATTPISDLVRAE